MLQETDGKTNFAPQNILGPIAQVVRAADS